MLPARDAATVPPWEAGLARAGAGPQPAAPKPRAVSDHGGQRGPAESESTGPAGAWRGGCSWA